MGIRATRESPLLAAREGRTEQGRVRRLVHPAGVGALTAVVAAAYCVFALAQYHTFRTSSYDLVIFDQAVRSYAHFKPGVAVIFGVHEGFGANVFILSNHFSPIDALLAPLYWIYNSPQTLLVAQAFLFALAIPWLWVFTRRAFGGGPRATAAAYLVSVAYALSWPIASALAFDFHEVAFAPVLTAIALERIQAGRLRMALIALGALLLVKEDMGLLVAGIGIYLAVARPRTLNRQLLVGLGLVVAGGLAAWISTDVLIPAAGGRSLYWAYQNLGPGIPQAVEHLILHPLRSAQVLVTPQMKLDTMLWLFGAFCFLSALAHCPGHGPAAARAHAVDGKFPAWWGTTYRYNAYLVVVLICAAVDGAARLDRSMVAWRARAARRQASGETAAAPGGAGWVALGGAAAMCVVALVLVPRFAFGSALHPSFYQRNATMKAAAAADAMVPGGATVAAVGYLGPQLSARDTVLLWDGDRYTNPTAAPWVVATSEPGSSHSRACRSSASALRCSSATGTGWSSAATATSSCTARGRQAPSAPRGRWDESRLYDRRERLFRRPWPGGRGPPRACLSAECKHGSRRVSRRRTAGRRHRRGCGLPRTPAVRGGIPRSSHSRA